MSKFVRKIELMHEMYGKVSGYTCMECSNLIVKRWDKVYRKCAVYGDTNGEGTDWALRWTACGMFNKEPSNMETRRFAHQRKEPEIQIDGQMEIGGAE